MLTHAALIGLASAPLIAQSDRPTLSDMAIGHGGVSMSIQGCGPAVSLADVVQRADLIVEGIVRTRASYLTDAGRNIFTDYDLAIGRALFQREMLVSPRPGVAMPLIFKSHGGQVVVDGLSLSVDVRSNSARVTLTEGDHVYLFATRDRHDGKWLINPSDVFKVVNGAVVTPDEFSDLPRSVPLDTFVQRIYQLQPAAAIRP
jgi:hypothetical protein